MNIEEILSNARTKKMSRLFKEAMLDCLWVLGEQPRNHEALKLVEDILQTVNYRERKYKLDAMLLDDPRLNKSFSQCDKCGAWWFPDNSRREGDLMLTSDPGGFDPVSKQYFCEKCVIKSGSVIKSPVSGKLMVVSPKPSGRDPKKIKADGGESSLSFPLGVQPVSSARLAAAYIFKIGNPPIPNDKYITEASKALIPERDSSSAIFLEIMPRLGEMTSMFSRITSRAPRFADQSNYDIFWQEFPDGTGKIMTIAKIFEKTF